MLVCWFDAQGLLVRGADGKVTYRQRGEDLEVSQKLLNIQVRRGCACARARACVGVLLMPVQWLAE